MRIVSTILFAIAALVGGCAVVVYLYLTNLACGYAPSAASCQAAPWDLAADDRFWLIGVPSAAVSVLVATALWARHKADQQKP